MTQHVSPTGFLAESSVGSANTLSGLLLVMGYGVELVNPVAMGPLSHLFCLKMDSFFGDSIV